MILELFQPKASLIDNILKISQICFYIIVSFITVLTYLKAKRGLLSSVNTEYHKKIIERLDELSRKLFEEYDDDSPNHWSKKRYVIEAVEKIHERFRKHAKSKYRARKFHSGIPVNPDYSRLSNLVTVVKSDPFIPKPIRDMVVSVIGDRAQNIALVNHLHLEAYIEHLASGKIRRVIDDNKYGIHNEINSALIAKGWGIEDIEKKTHQIRLEIQKYFDNFSPK